MKRMLHAHFGAKQVEKIFLINAPIVNVIIGQMLWDPEDVEGQTHASMIVCFRDGVDKMEALLDGQGYEGYSVVIKNRLQLFLAIDYLATGLSFRQVSRVLHNTKERSGMASIGMCTDVTISNIRVGCLRSQPPEGVQTFRGGLDVLCCP